jgi:hypothetical protein
MIDRNSDLRMALASLKVYKALPFCAATVAAGPTAIHTRTSHLSIWR